MNWYKKSKEISRISGKTYRDDKSIISLYHVSPKRLTSLQPLSRFEKYTGLYMSPSYNSLIRDWASYVMGRKHNTDLDAKIRELGKKIDELEGEYKKAKKPSDQLKLDELNKELDRAYDSTSSKGYQAATKGYEKVYIHKMLCPKETYDKCVSLFNEVRDSGYRSGAWNFWDWGSQIFVPAEYLKDLQIISSKPISRDDFREEYKSLGIGTNTRPSLKLNPKQQREFDAEEQRRKSETPEETRKRIEKKQNEQAKNFLFGPKKEVETYELV